MTAATVNPCGAGYAPDLSYVPIGVTVRAGLANVLVGGHAQIAVYGGIVGGYIQNPAAPTDQGAHPTDNPESLYVNFTGPAALDAGGDTLALQPGEGITLPADCATDIWVNASRTGHAYSVIVTQPGTQFPPVSYTGAYPPAGPVGLTTTLPSYLYDQYTGDDNLEALVRAYNALSQNFLDWFNELNLPVYTKLNGALLDWVGKGLYGLVRPTLYSGMSRNVGPYDTQLFNEPSEYNQFDIVDDITDVALTNDDVYKRILTWNLYRGDGHYVNALWIKRRVARFLFGTGGTDPDDATTNNISVIVGGGDITITIVSGLATNNGGAIFDESDAYNTFAYDETNFVLSPLPIPAMANTLVEAVNTGALPLPYQYSASALIAPIGVPS